MKIDVGHCRKFVLIDLGFSVAGNQGTAGDGPGVGKIRQEDLKWGEIEKNRYLGFLIGLAVGDALGTTLEFKRPGTFKPIKNMVGGGPFGLKAGEWTDDTSMALCLAESLIECKGFDHADQMKRYLKWYREGYLSSNARCFDIGNTVRDALVKFEKTWEPFSGSTDPFSAGNGSIMRLAPVAMFYAGSPWQRA